MKWKGSSCINWSDFRGKINEKSPFDAQVYTGIQYSLSYSIVDGKTNVDFEVYSFFSPEKSWSKKEKQSVHLLQHEQLHFDISELYARKIREALLSFQFQGNPEEDFEQIFQKYNAERKLLQQEYDQATNHSKDHSAQKKWNVMIAKELVNYADFD